MKKNYKFCLFAFGAFFSILFIAFKTIKYVHPLQNCLTLDIIMVFTNLTKIKYFKTPYQKMATYDSF